MASVAGQADESEFSGGSVRRIECFFRGYCKCLILNCEYGTGEYIKPPSNMNTVPKSSRSAVAGIIPAKSGTGTPSRPIPP
jgi:hypothetical protein